MDQSVRPMPALDPCLFRAARAALGWTLLETGQRAGVSPAAVLIAEGRGVRSSSASPTALDRLRHAFEKAGVSFNYDSAGHGLRIAFS